MKKLIDIIKKFYGMNNKEAKQYLKTISEEQKKYLIAGFEENARKSFYND